MSYHVLNDAALKKIANKLRVLRIKKSTVGLTRAIYRRLQDFFLVRNLGNNINVPLFFNSADRYHSDTYSSIVDFVQE